LSLLIYPKNDRFADIYLTDVGLILRHLLRICAPLSHWPQRVEKLMDDFSAIPIEKMGVPENWKKHPVWYK